MRNRLIYTYTMWSENRQGSEQEEAAKLEKEKFENKETKRARESF